MNINETFPSNYIKHSDLQGRTLTVVMTEVKMESMGAGQDHKPVVYFQGKEKGLVLNKTKANIIAGTYGPDTAGWTGKSIQISPGQTTYMGQPVSCINVSLGHEIMMANEVARQAPIAPPQQQGAPLAPAPAQGPLPAEEDFDDSIPF